MYYHPNSGWVELICGSMFSGKTEELLRRIRRAEIARKCVQVFKPSLDNRYGRVRVASHNGVAREDALVVAQAAEIVEQVRPETDFVAIDEIQFFDDAIAYVCQQLADQGRRVVAAGLDQDFRGEPFGPMPLLMATAERVDKLHAICVVCGARSQPHPAPDRRPPRPLRRSRDPRRRQRTLRSPLPPLPPTPRPALPLCHYILSWTSQQQIFCHG